MKILFVTPEYDSHGGIQTCVRNWEEGLADIGHDIGVLHVEPGDDHRRPTDFWPRVSPIKDVRAFRWVYQETVARVTREAIRSADYDLVHVLHTAAWPALDVARKHGVPTVLSTYGMELGEAVATRALRRAGHIQAISPYTRNLAADRGGLVPDDITVIPPAIDVPAYGRGAADNPNGPIVVICRLVGRKQVGMVVDAHRHLDSDRELVIVGDGPDRGRLKRLAGPGVRFTGWLPESEKRNYLRRASVLALPAGGDGYDVEGFGIVYIESQAARTPVVGTPFGGSPFAIGDGGVIVDPPVDAERVADALRQLLGGHDRERCLAAAEEHINRFDLPTVARQFDALYTAPPEPEQRPIAADD